MFDRREYNRKYREINKVRLREYKHKYYEEHKDKIKEYYTIHYRNNKVYLKEQRRVNKDKIEANRKNYNNKNKSILQVYGRERSRHKRGKALKPSISTEEWKNKDKNVKVCRNSKGQFITWEIM